MLLNLYTHPEREILYRYMQLGWEVPESLKAGSVVAMKRVVIAHTLCIKVDCSQTPVHTHVHRNKNHVKFKDVNLLRERERER